MRAIEIMPATIRDATFVLYNLRAADQIEVMCQLPQGVSLGGVAHTMLMSGDNYAARVDDQPVAFFGWHALNAACSAIWAIGTDNMWRAVPAITDYVLEAMVPDMLLDGFVSMEARSHVDHVVAHKWMVYLGAKQHGGPYVFGRDREMFLTFRWTDDVFERIKRKRRRAA